MFVELSGELYTIYDELGVKAMKTNTTQCRHGILVQAENKCEQCTRAEIAKKLATALAEMLIKKQKP